MFYYSRKYLIMLIMVLTLLNHTSVYAVDDERVKEIEVQIQEYEKKIAPYEYMIESLKSELNSHKSNNEYTTYTYDLALSDELGFMLQYVAVMGEVTNIVVWEDNIDLDIKQKGFKDEEVFKVFVDSDLINSSIAVGDVVYIKGESHGIIEWDEDPFYKSPMPYIIAHSITSK